MLFFILIQILIEHHVSNSRERDQTSQSVASDLGLFYLSMSHKKNASLTWVNTFVVYVTHISCIVSSSNWIMIGYRVGLTI